MDEYAFQEALYKLGIHSMYYYMDNRPALAAYCTTCRRRNRAVFLGLADDCGMSCRIFMDDDLLSKHAHLTNLVQGPRGPHFITIKPMSVMPEKDRDQMDADILMSEVK